ncbi:conserved hypothetical protein [Cenarchaeum symbiosum A]|uniref:Cobalamin adenosyltransferase-like domain-containing protein n=1 Tax=Cenarchaeum symbiosum (strain A) TaxID=414004 RepID=A0RU57_CENSY|nr:conserved hypothetical protein [Cenarchaeum symbiosum A]
MNTASAVSASVSEIQYCELNIYGKILCDAVKIYTKTGDDGTTGLQGGRRVPKSDPRISAYGGVDEINSLLGVVLSHGLEGDIESIMARIQNELFVTGADLSNPNLEDGKNRVTEQMVKRLEDDIDMLEEKLEPLTSFILPGGDVAAAFIHLARTAARRAETLVVILEEKEKINPWCRIYLNRLADILFVMARIRNSQQDCPDVPWVP